MASHWRVEPLVGSYLARVPLVSSVESLEASVDILVDCLASGPLTFSHNTNIVLQNDSPAKTWTKTSNILKKIVRNTENPEIFARILFSRIALKDIFAALKFATRA